jgi:6-phosphogluconolactonase
MGAHGSTLERRSPRRGRLAHLVRSTDHRAAAVMAVAVLSVTSAAATAAPADGSATAGTATGDAHSVYVTNSDNVPSDPGDANITRFTIRPDGRLTAAETVPASQGTRGIVFTPDRRHAYVVSMSSNEVSAYQIGPGGELGRRLGSVPSPGPFGITMAPDGDTVYVGELGGGQVAAFAVQPDGRLARQDTEVPAVPVPKDVAVTPDGRFLYVSHGDFSDEAPDAVSGFELEADGDLGRPLPPVPAGASGAEITVTPDGRFVYATHQISNEIVGYRIGRDGQLTEVARVVSPSERVEGAAVSPDGRLLYAGAFGFQPTTPDFPPDPTRPSALLAFRIGSGGELTPAATVPTPDPIGLAFGPDGRRLYVSSYSASEIATFAVQPTGGLTPLQTLPSGGPRPAFQSVSVPSS